MPKDDRPIYIQLIECLQCGILTAKYPPGSVFPSVRILADKYKVNPNTVQRAVSELAARGLIHTNRTAMKRVTKNREEIEKTRKTLIFMIIKAYFDEMKSLGISIDEAVKYIESRSS